MNHSFSSSSSSPSSSSSFEESVLDLDKYTFLNKKRKSFYRLKYNPNENVVLLNFQMQQFNKQTLEDAINIISYGVMCDMCTNQRKEPTQILLFQTQSNPPQFSIAYTVGLIHFIEYFKYDQISELKKGSSFRLIRRDNIMHANFDNTLSLELEEQNISVTLIFQSKEIRNLIWQGFQHSVIQYMCSQIKKVNQQSLSQVFDGYQKEDPVRQMGMQELQELLRQVKVQTSKNQLKKYFESKGHQKKDKALKISQVKNIVKRLTEKSEVKEIFKYYIPKEFINKDEKALIMSEEGFQRFLFQQQKEDKNISEVKEIFKQLHKDKVGNISDQQPTHLISLSQFSNYLFSNSNSILQTSFKCSSLNHKGEKYEQEDFSKPITDYYINCSRHFYSSKIDIKQSLHIIEGDKENPDFSNKFLPIHFILNKGVRCASVEIWDGDENEPVILYGHTMNSKLRLSEMLKIFMKYVFKNNSLPFFFEFDFHCKPVVMQNVKKHFEEILLPYLYLIPPDFQQMRTYPSLLQLKFKIIIIGKLPFKLKNTEIDIPNDNNNHYQFLKSDSIDMEIMAIEQDGEREILSKNQNLKLLSEKSNESKMQLSFSPSPVLTYSKDNSDLSMVFEVSCSSPNKQFEFKRDSSSNLLSNSSEKNSPFPAEDKLNIGKKVNDFQPKNKEQGEDRKNCIAERSLEKRVDQCEKTKLGLSSHISMIKEASNIEKYFTFFKKRFLNQSPPFLFELFELSFREYENLFDSKNPQQISIRSQIEETSHKMIEQSNSKFNEELMNRNSLNFSPLTENYLTKQVPSIQINLKENYKEDNNQFQQIQTFTQSNLLKINPSGKKFDAPNFDPCFPIWQGVQFLMLSHHNFDVHNLIYSSFFMKQGDKYQGFILKPPELRSDFICESLKSVSDIKRYVYYIKIISGSQLRSLRGEQVDPQVIVVLRTPPEQEQDQFYNDQLIQTTLLPFQAPKNRDTAQVFKSCIVKNNNSNPLFEYEIKFSAVHSSLSFLNFNVINTRYDNLLGWYAIPLNQIREGYRTVPLKDENLNPIQNCFLLCQIKITQDI